MNKYLIIILINNIGTKKKISFHYTYFLIFTILENLFIIFLISHFLSNIHNYLKIKKLIINYNPKIYNQVTKFNEFNDIFLILNSTIIKFYFIILLNSIKIFNQFIIFLKNIIFILLIFF